MSKYEKNQKLVEAFYDVPVQNFYKNNPIIEALPTAMSPEEIVRELRNAVRSTEEERKLPSYERNEFIPAIYQCFQPWGAHVELAQKVFNAIKSGYVGRNPLDKSHIGKLNELSECIQNKDFEFRAISTNSGAAAGFCVIGLSGTGKTTSMNRILDLYPQIIIHSNYKGNPFAYKQLVWMKLECPFDGSVKGLCSNFFQEFDRLTGDNTYAKFAAGARATTDTMIPQMAMIARRHSLGVLVIDEIQYISAAKSGGMEKMLNFITNLVNTIGVPVILIGIPDAIEILSSSLVLARRSSGQQGSVFLRHHVVDSCDWNIFLKGIWKAQWTSEKTLLTDELSMTLAEESAGIADVAVKLYARTQEKAIQLGTMGGNETITSELIKKVAKSDDFKLLKHKIDELKNSKSKSIMNADLALFNWDRVKKNDIKNSLPKRAAEGNTVRNDELQNSIAIPSKKNISELSLNVELPILTMEEEY